jgi:hypothetical protein
MSDSELTARPPVLTHIVLQTQQTLTARPPVLTNDVRLQHDASIRQRLLQTLAYAGVC